MDVQLKPLDVDQEQTQLSSIQPLPTPEASMAQRGYSLLIEELIELEEVPLCHSEVTHTCKVYIPVTQIQEPPPLSPQRQQERITSSNHA